MVQVRRKAYVEPENTLFVHTGSEFKNAGATNGGTSAFKENQELTVDGIDFSFSGYIYSKYANNTDYISLTSKSGTANGSLVNTSPYPQGILNVVASEATPNIQISKDGNNWIDLESANTTDENYYYFKMYYKNTSQSGYVNIPQIQVTLKGEITSLNFANYLMFEDTNGQCVTKYDTAKLYFESLSKEERSTFVNSEDYVLSSACARLEAWASYHHESIKLSNGDYILSLNSFVTGSISNSQQGIIIVIISAVAIISLSSVVVVLIIKRRKVC